MNRAGGPALAVLALAAAGAGCTPISEPWVADDKQYAEERARTEPQQRALIERARHGQRDR